MIKSYDVFFAKKCSLDTLGKMFFAVCFCVFTLNLLILSVSAVENRFSLPLLVILMPFAFFAFFTYKKNIKIMSGFLFWLVVSHTLNSFIELQKNIPYFGEG